MLEGNNTVDTLIDTSNNNWINTKTLLDGRIFILLREVLIVLYDNIMQKPILQSDQIL